jgi:glutamate synthase domain-containing protein 3
MDAIIGLIGTIIGAAIAGGFVYFKDKQQHDFEVTKERRSLLIEKYELIYKEFDLYQAFATDISMQMISEAGYRGKFNPDKIRKDIKSANLRMNITFYAPELLDIFEKIDKKYLLIIRTMGEFILKFDASKDQKGKLTGEAAIALAEMGNLIGEAKDQLSKSVGKQIHA